eukprot:GHVL01022150.1.p1 GENE.GHVL01022150.1~~GHVL01022150.1.p1  ORF type:complete len:2139 (-),score=439.72 GHVL01022150.1:17-6322(-)
MVNEVQEGFGAMRRAQHIGKVVITLPSCYDTSGSLIVTGGMGALGALVMKMAVTEGFKKVYSLSRREANKYDSRWNWLKESKAKVVFLKCDVSNEQDLANTIKFIKESSTITTVIHAAGVLEDALMTNQTLDSINNVYQAKVRGAWNLHLQLPETNIVFFSSTAALCGNSGQTNYSAANSTLDGISIYRNHLGFKSKSVQWGPWGEVGMAADLHTPMKRLGITPLTNTVAISSLYAVLNFDSNILAVMPINWNRYTRSVKPFGLISNLVDKKKPIESKVESSVITDDIEKLVITVAKGVIGSTEEIPMDAPLSEIGIDSLGAVEFRNEISKKTKLRLAATLIFDYPSLGAIIGYLKSKITGDTAKVSKNILPTPKGSDFKLAIVGLAFRFPCGGDWGEMWENLINGRDCISEVPLSRWDVDKWYDTQGGGIDGNSYMVREAGLIPNIDSFDRSKYNLSHAEVLQMDPQQRLLMEVVNECLLSHKTINGTATGVFVGCCNYDWTYLKTTTQTKINAFTGTGVSGSLLANRVSYFYGFSGSSVTVDTACSSSLVALDIAMDKSLSSETVNSIVAGVHVMSCHIPWCFLSKANMLSPNARCRTFDNEADGYVRGEGCGAILLTDSSAVVQGRDNVYGYIRAASVNHDGRSASVTAPNGPSQTACIQAAIAKANLQPSEISYIETHGTGTALGDPIEIGAIQECFSKQSNNLYLGALKSNIGHLEGAAGIAGLIKLVMVLSNRVAPKILHFNKLNEHIDLQGISIIIPNDTIPIDAPKDRNLIGGVSSFGFGGTNSHVIVEGVSNIRLRPIMKKTQSAIPWVFPKPHPLLGYSERVEENENVEIRWCCRLRPRGYELLSGHIIKSRILVPGSAYLDMAVSCGLALLSDDSSYYSCTIIEVKDVMFLKPLTVRKDMNIKAVLEDNQCQILAASSADEEETVICEFTVQALSSDDFADRSLEVLKKDLQSYSNVNIDDFYEKLSKNDLLYEGLFKCVKNIWISNREAVGFLTVTDYDLAYDDGYNVHPALLDGAFQLVASLLMDDNEMDKSMVPFSVRRFRNFFNGGFTNTALHPVSSKIWAKTSIIQMDNELIEVNVLLWDADFDSPIVEVEGLMLRNISQEVSSTTTRQGASPDSILWDVDWKEIGWSKFAIKDSEIIFTGSTTCVKFDKFKIYSIDEMNRLDIGYDRMIIYLGGLEKTLDHAMVMKEALFLCQKFMKTKTKMWLLTSGIHEAYKGDKSPGESIPYHAGLWGLGLTVNAETAINDDGFSCGVLDLPPNASSSDPYSWGVNNINNLLRSLYENSETELTVRKNGIIYGRRIERLSLTNNIVFSQELHMSSRGSLNNLILRPQGNRPSPRLEEVEVRVQAAGLNFRDVLNVLGMYPGNPGAPGGDCAGVISRLGGESHLRIGDSVFGIAPGCLKYYCCTNGNLMQKAPEHVSIEQAACMPVVFVTVQVALGDIAKLKKGDKILIHTASGGVGLAAIQFCKAIGVDIYATVGSQEKVDYIKGLGVKNITTSRDAETFIDDMNNMLGTNKLDAVLNTLNEDYIPSSAKLLKAGGKFLELGKRGIWSQEQMSDEFSSVDYHIIAVDTMMAENPPWFGQQLLKVRDLVDMPASFSTPLPVKVFTMSSSETAIEAFRFLQSAKHIGKIVLKLPSVINQEDVANTNDYSPKVNKSTWLITGGTGALGVVMAEWLIGEGVKNVVLVSRSGEVPSGSLDSFNLLKKQTSIRLAVLKCDVSDESDVGSLWSRLGGGKKPLGVIHLAGCVNDAALADQTNDHIQNVYNAKVKGAWNIHRLSTNRTLTHFILFSSSAALSGSPGQANYSAANSCLDALSLHRMSLGLPSTSIQWGPWGEQGMASNLKESMERRGIFSISNILALQCFEIILSMCRPVTAVLNINWAKYISTLPSVPKSIQVFSGKDDKVKNSSISQYQPLQKISKETVTKTLVRVVTGIVGSNLKGDLSVQPLRNLGVDSLGAVEFRNEIQKLLNIKVSATLLFDYPTIEKIADFLMTKITPREKTVKTTKIIKSNKKEEKIAIVGMALRLPGGVENTKLLWEALLEGNDLISDVPLGRWDSDKLYSDDRCETWMCYVKEDGLMKSVH